LTSYFSRPVFSEPNTLDFKPNFKNEEERLEYQHNEYLMERQWYDDENQCYNDEFNPFADISDEFVRKKEAEFKRNKLKKAKLSAKELEFKRERDKWINNRLGRSGVVQLAGELDSDFDNEIDENTTTILVHNIVPPFLDGRIAFTKQQNPIVPVKDVTCDMAVAATKGSRQVRLFREQEEKKKAQEKHWELAGSNLGKIMGIKEEVDTGEMEANASADYKESHKFSAHMKEENQAVSEFALEKTIKEQREYLPVFAVRQKMMTVIRENSVVVIVGETGSGE
jgi:pre-mRNA-splicing factor ATP-dependent RNA helicase DHX38/PRP16